MTTNTLTDDLAALRHKCFRIEAGLPSFNDIQSGPMTDAQMVRHELWMIRCEIDRTISRVKRDGVEYPMIGNSFATVEPD